MHTIRHFQLLADTVFVTLPKQWFEYWQHLQEEYAFDVPHVLIEGGETRFESVRNAVAHLPNEGLAAVHDAVRPFVSSAFVLSCFEHAEKYGSAVAAINVKDSLRMRAEGKTKAVDRNDFFAVQTPQVFPCEIIKKAYQQEFQPHFTDDASLVEACGYDIELIQGDERNIKITTKEDLLFAECMFDRLTMNNNL
jgi:2-C-methyl-D-erythritol 4-phosphate cytidylyltransferase